MASRSKKRLTYGEYTVAIVCPLEVEMSAARYMLDEEHERLPTVPGDTNKYFLGQMSGHNVVIAVLPEGSQGIGAAATVAINMIRTFTSIQLRLLVGIGGGIPTEKDIRLGDVVVSMPSGAHGGVVQYDMGKETSSGFERKGFLYPPPGQWRQVITHMISDHRIRPNQINTILTEMLEKYPQLEVYRRPPPEMDILFAPDNSHISGQKTCEKCDETNVVTRNDRRPDESKLFYGLIASGNMVIKNATRRDEISSDAGGALCFEMEAAGLMNNFECIVVRGISDYADSHKNDDWHPYAAAAAAACAKELLTYFDPIIARDIVAHNSFVVPLSISPVSEIRYFVGRNNELATMYEHLRHDGSRRTVVLHGLGGMGKTQLALTFAKRHRNDFSAVFWLNSKDEDTLKQSYLSVAERILEYYPAVLDLKIAIQSGDLDQVIPGVQHWLNQSENTRWLLIYDNYDTPKLAGEDDPKAYELSRFLPASYHGAVIITTRSSEVDIGHQIPVRKLVNVQHSREILSYTSGRQIGPAAPTQTRRTSLAIATAGAYLRQTPILFSRYLKLYEQSWLKLQITSPQIRSYEDRALYSTWTISLDYVTRHNPLAAHLLRLWAYFSNQDVWFELLHGGRQGAPSWFLDLTEDELSFYRATRVLCDHALIEADLSTILRVESAGYSMHGCIHSWTSNVLNQGRNLDIAQLALQCVGLNVPSNTDQGYWITERRLLEHANACQAYIDEVVDYNCTDLSYHAIRSLGLLYTHQDKLGDAEAMYQRALQGYEKTLGREHTSTLDTVNNLGSLYRNQSKLGDAEAMYQRALQGYEKALGREHTSTLSTVNNLGNIYRNQGKLGDAEAMYQRAQQGYEKALGRKHTSTLSTVNNLGNIYADQGKLGDTEAMYQRAQQGYEKALGREHTLTLSTVNNLGIIYADQGKLDNAEAMYQRALQGYEKALGREHTSTLDTVNNLGSLYRNQGKLGDAEAMYQRALQGYEKALSREHTSTLSTVNNLGIIYRNQDKLGDAEAMYQRALEGYKRALGTQGMVMYRPALASMLGMGELHKKQGRWDKPEQMLSQALNGFQAIYGPNHEICQYLASALTKEREDA